RCQTIAAVSLKVLVTCLKGNPPLLDLHRLLPINPVEAVALQVHVQRPAVHLPVLVRPPVIAGKRYANTLFSLQAVYSMARSLCHESRHRRSVTRRINPSKLTDSFHSGYWHRKRVSCTNAGTTM